MDSYPPPFELKLRPTCHPTHRYGSHASRAMLFRVRLPFQVILLLTNRSNPSIAASLSFCCRLSTSPSVADRLCFSAEEINSPSVAFVATGTPDASHPSLKSGSELKIVNLVRSTRYGPAYSPEFISHPLPLPTPKLQRSTKLTCPVFNSRTSPLIK
jgi:hypothetical protein